MFCSVGLDGLALRSAGAPFASGFCVAGVALSLRSYGLCCSSSECVHALDGALLCGFSCVGVLRCGELIMSFSIELGPGLVSLHVL